MKTTSSVSNRSLKDEDMELYDESDMQWSDALFIPFHPIFRLVVLICVIHKTFLGPLQASFGIASCSGAMDFNTFTQACRYFYTVLANGIYFLDTFLHIVHRQVTDKAVRREHLPKSAFLILLDVLSLIPFSDLVARDLCVRTFWPNILSFTEFIVIYRVVEYFDLIKTHTIWKLYIGYTLILVLCVNCLTCLLLLLTFDGLCANCKKTEDFYDWRKYTTKEYAHQDFIWYFYGFQYIFSNMINYTFDDTKPSTFLEFLLAGFLMACGYALNLTLFVPKFLSEAVLSLRWISTFHPHVTKLIQETKRRNPSPKAHTSLQNFYNLMWKQRSGIINIPQLYLPRHLRLELRQDLVWQVFYHSPTLRKTSTPFKRYLSENIRQDYKLPGAKFFSGPNSYTHLYYLKSGIVQFISLDDGSTPLLSVSAGTLFGDVSFIIPPLSRKTCVKCLTYCEVMYISRNDLLKSLSHYPDDRKKVIQLAHDKLRHARTLYSCKQNIKGLDRAEDEGLDWVKRRWWEISDTIDSYKKRARSSEKCEIPAEETLYHCAKYLGQLVLCNEVQLKKTSLFVNDKFPWVLAPHSTFCHVWHIFIQIIVMFVLLTFPPSLSSKNLPAWFTTAKYFTDFVYIADICVSLCTSIDTKEYMSTNFASVMLLRCKEPTFVMDVLAALWIEYLTLLIGKPEYYNSCQFNRLIKIYVLFPRDWSNWSIGQDHYFPVYLSIFLSYFSITYIAAFVVFILLRYFPNLTGEYFFGDFECNNPNISETQCVLNSLNHIFVALRFVFEYTFGEVPPEHILDIAVNMVVCYHIFVLSVYCKSRFIAAVYLRLRETLSYQRFVTNLRLYYRVREVHINLLIRIEKYLICHWKYYHGIDMLRPNSLKEEPYDVFWKVQGEVAEKIISESDIFLGADPLLIRELALMAKYLIMPQTSTLYLFGVLCKNVTWVVQGHVKCEYIDSNGEQMKRFYGPGDMIAILPVILGNPPIRSYTAYTDCEIIHINVSSLNNVMKRYPQEREYLQRTIDEFSPLFSELNEKYITENAEYLKKIRERLFTVAKTKHRLQLSKLSLHDFRRNRTESKRKETSTKKKTADPFHIKPESKFILFWMAFRALTVFVSITTAALLGKYSFLKGGGGINFKKELTIVRFICSVISLIDILLKFFIAYYNEKGILVMARNKTVMNYLTHCFTMDVIGVLPWDHIISFLLSDTIPGGSLKLIYTTAQFAHLYMLTGYLDYLADRPSAICPLIKIAKWQLVTILLTLASSHFFVNNCIEFTFNDDDDVVDMKRLDACWIPDYMVLDNRPTPEQLKMVFAHSINLAQSGLMHINSGDFKIKEDGNILVAVIVMILGTVYWFVVAYSVTLLVLIPRSDTLFQHGINQLETFLRSERVETNIIERTLGYFNYWWIRTRGINVYKVMFERVGLVYRQDLHFFFYQQTFATLDIVLKGGEQFQRQLSSVCTPMYVLPHEEIMREMDLMPYVFVVHRGRVMVSLKGQHLATLTKGAMFGQLTGTRPRPVTISVHADSYTDIAKMSLKQFNETISDEIRERINNTSSVEFDFIATKRTCHENPLRSIRYLLRGRKSIQLPWMMSPKEVHRGNCYYRWLHWVWLYEPAVSAAMTAVILIMPDHATDVFIWFFIIFDLIRLAHTISEYFTVEVTVVDDKCVNRRRGHRIFKDWRVYIDMFSLIVPFFAYIFDCYYCFIARLARLLSFYDFQKHFCRTFKGRWSSLFLKFSIYLLLIHYMTCGWINFACKEETFPVPLPKPSNNRTIDFNEWSYADQRAGCARVTREFKDAKGDYQVSFVVPNDWWANYIVAFTFVIILQTHINLGIVMQLTVQQIYYKVFITAIIYMLDIWLMSVAVGAVYTKFRELYQYDFNVRTLNLYLVNSGLSPTLVKSVFEYTTHLWDRQRGNWLPELAHQAPDCLREDILGALYLHHILTPPIFRQLPKYFTRQLVARVGRVVIFPGQSIVQEGDINATIYFIHEGEVEKWMNYTSPERKLASILTTNSYFGFVPGLFPHSRFLFTYVSRTVVDIVYLKMKEWKDLLEAYPEVKESLYSMASHLKAREHKKDPPTY